MHKNKKVLIPSSSEGRGFLKTTSMKKLLPFTLLALFSSLAQADFVFQQRIAPATEGQASPLQITDVCTGANHILVLASDKTLWSSGSNYYGSLGLGDTNMRSTLEQTLEGVEDIACSAHDSYALMSDGSIWATGRNNYNQIPGSTGVVNSWVQTSSLGSAEIIDIKTGYGSIRALDSLGNLYVAGRNTYGQLGLGHINEVTGWSMSTTGVTKIVGSNHNAFILKGFNLYGAGFGSYGQFGTGNASHQPNWHLVDDSVNYAIGSNRSALKLKDSTLYGAGDNNNGELGIGNLNNQSVWTQISTNVKSVGSTYYSLYYVDNLGKLFAAGHNGYGQLGNGNENSSYNWVEVMSGVESIAEGTFGFSAVVKMTNGEFWGAGLNLKGELGLGDTESRNTFTKISIPN